MRALFVLLIAVASGCSRGGNPLPSAPDAREAPPPLASAAPLASAPPAADAGSAWSGRYTAVAGSLYIPDGGEWSGLRFRGEDASVGLGEGTFRLTVGPAGRAEGTIDGALGALRVEGVLEEGALEASLVPPRPAADFAGTAVGRAEGGRIQGTMRLSLPRGNVVREATFTLSRDR